MQEIYGLGLLREKKEPYCYPLLLKEIDSLTTEKTKKELLEILKQNDSTITEAKEEKIKIFQQYENHWRESNIEYITKNTEYILTFSIKSLLERENSKKVLNILHSHFFQSYSKKYTSEAMKKTIDAMKLEKHDFLKSLEYLSYIEIRAIRVYLSKQFDVSTLPKEKKKERKEQILPVHSSEEIKGYSLEMKNQVK